MYTLKVETGMDECDCCGYYDWTERELFNGNALTASHYGDSHLAGDFHTDLDESLWVLGNIKGVDVVEYTTPYIRHSVAINEFAYEDSPIICNVVIEGGDIIVDGRLLCTYNPCELSMEDVNWWNDGDEAAMAMLEALSVKVA